MLRSLVCEKKQKNKKQNLNMADARCFLGWKNNILLSNTIGFALCFTERESKI